jgi:hypothetical protein
MGRIDLATARQFIDRVELPFPRREGAAARDAGAPPAVTAAAFDTAKNQAAVVGGDVFAFVKGVTAERREAIVNSSLLAQLVASRKFDRSKIYDWYNVYFDALTNVGWAVQEHGFAEYTERADNFDAHKAILSVAATLLGPVPGALALITSTLTALQSMDENKPWITIFNRESQKAETARFQIGLAQQDEAGDFSVTVMAFGLEAKDTVTQVLFFRARSSEATLRHYLGRVTINTAVLDGIRDGMKAKLINHAQEYISALPDLG